MTRDPLVGRSASPGMADNIGIAVFKHLLAHIEIAQFEGLWRGQERPLAGIILDDGRQMHRERPVVGKVRSQPVGHGERTLAHTGEKSRHTELAVPVESHRIEQRGGQPPQDDIDPLHPRDGLEIKPAVEDDEIAALHDRDTHLPRQGGVVQIVFVAAAAREEDTAGRALRFAHQLLQDVEHLRREILHRQNLLPVEETRYDLAHDLPLLERIGGPFGHAEMLLHDHPFAAVILLEIERGELQIRHRRARHARATAMKIRIGVNDLVGNDSRLENFLAAVDVVQEGIPCADPLREARLDPRPLVAAQHQGHEIEAGARAKIGPGLAGGEVGAVLLVQFVRQCKDAIEMIRRHAAQFVLDLVHDGGGTVFAPPRRASSGPHVAPVLEGAGR